MSEIYRRPVEVDAANWCHNHTLYRYQLTQAQYRCNINDTTELVALVDEQGNIVESRVITSNTAATELARNKWEKPQ